MPGNESVQATFDRYADRYDRHAALEKEIGERLLERVAYRHLEPGVAVDLGCGTGSGTAKLKKRLRKARVIGLDISAGMLEQARKKSRVIRPFRLVRAEMDDLPFASRSVDLLYSNLAIPWMNEPAQLFDEVRRVLRPDGMFLFSTLGPDSLSPLGRAAHPSMGGESPRELPDLLEIGDALTRAGFKEPVMDIDRVNLDYPDVAALTGELEITGKSLLVSGWSQLVSNQEQLARDWEGHEEGNRYPIGFEIIYGVAFGPPEGQPRRTENGEIATFSVDSLLKSRNLGYD